MVNDRAISRVNIAVLIILLAMLMISALAVIYSKNVSRSIFIEIERHERALDQYEVEWGQMQLELSTLAEQNRVERIAKERLKLVLPPHESIIYIKP
ncbi:cell division protein FtsL [Methyloglobulus sp.]|jgi:cell division protein FtsL|uniref:cell division protein FtsL n=1 Tax=Methyloglobulus sp. TaxID=2518622 RepID=UPI0032B71177